MVDDNVKRVKDRINIVDVIGQVVELKKRGRNYVGLCPFHNEKTPSFSVSEDRQIFKCFGCGKSGDAITFIMERDKMSFQEALEYLADKAGITLENTKENRIKKISSEKFLKINELAAKFYFSQLITSKTARDYLRNREITDSSINKFFLGYADERWDKLYNFMVSKGVEVKDLVSLGLVSQGKNGKYYDRFRNRIMFPIFDIKKRVIGFGGRTLVNDPAKYMNSPESFVFHKGDNLYALNLVHANRDRKNIVLVEGYMDVIGLHQKGIDYAVAALGTALTERQANLLKRYGENLYICYDADGAGIKATLRAIEIMNDVKAKAHIVSLGEGKDPDDFIKAYGKEAFEQKLKNSENPNDYRLGMILNSYDKNNTEKMEDVLKEVFKFISSIDSEVIKDEYLKKVSDIMAISHEALKDDFNKNKVENVKKFEKISKKTSLIKLNRFIIECMLLSFLSLDNYKSLRPYLEYFTSVPVDKIREFLDKYYLENSGEGQLKDFLESFPSDLDLLRAYYDLKEKDQTTIAKSIEELTTRLDMLKIREESEKLKSEISMLSSLLDSDPSKKEILLEKMTKLKENELKLRTKTR